MKVTFIYEDGSFQTKTMGCFGSCGRSDGAGVKPEHRKEYVEFCSRRELPYKTSDYQEDYTKELYSEPVKYIALSDGFEQLFHVRNRQIMEYLIERSPYKICFDVTYDQFAKDNKAKVLADGIPSEVTLSCLFMLRSIAGSSAMNDTFVQFRQYSTEFMALITTKMFPSYSLGSIYAGDYCTGGDSVFFDEHVSKQIIVSDDPFSLMDLFPYSVRDLQGYVMNIRKMWYVPEHDSINRNHVSTVVERHARSRKIQGLFGVFEVRGCVDAKAFLKDLWG